MAFVEDITPFLADFGVACRLDGQAVRGIFDSGANEPLPGITANVPSLQLATASVPTAVYGKALVHPTLGNYTVLQHLPDGTGLSLLILQAA